MSTLGSLLVQDQIVGVTQIEQALQHQVIYGGYLSTNLLELDLIPEDVLVEYSARVFGLPSVSWERILKTEREAIKAMPWTMVKKYDVLPFQIEEEKILVAVSEPLSDETLKELAFFVRHELEQYFLLDFRLAMGLNLFYGIPVPLRLKNLQQRFAPDFEIGRSPSFAPPLADKPAAAPKEEEVQIEIGSHSTERTDETIQAYNLRSDSPQTRAVQQGAKKRDDESTIQFYTQKPTQKRQSARVAMQSAATRDGTKAPVISSPATPSDAPVEQPDGAMVTDPGPSSSLDVEQAKEEFGQAQNRDQILELVAKYAGQVFEYSLLLVVHEKIAQGRLVMMGAHRDQGAEEISIPLDNGGMFETVFQTGSFHLGPLGITDVEDDALRQMGRNWPKNCAILPVLLRGRVILMLYGDSGERGVEDEQVAAFVLLTRCISEAFERILLEQKYKGYRVAKTTAPPNPVVPSYRPRVPESFQSYRSSSADRPSKTETPQTSIHPNDKATAKGKSLTDWAGRYHMQSDGQLAEEVRKRVSSKPPEPPKPSNYPSSGGRRSSAPSRTPRRSYSTHPPASDATRRDSRPATDASYYARGDSVPAPPPDKYQEKEVRDVEHGVDPRFERRHGPRDEAERARYARTARDLSVPPTPGQAQLGQKHSPPAAMSQRPRSVAQVRQEILRLVERVVTSGNYDEEAAEYLVEIGEDALVELVRHFPGPLLYDRYQASGKMPPISEHGPLLKTLVRFEHKVVPHVVPLLESVDSDVRFYATFLFSQLHYPEVLGALTARIFDNDPQIRELAIDVIRQFRQHSEYPWAIRELISAIEGSSTSLDTKRIAATALGDLREPAAVGALIRTLGAGDAVLVDRCQKALVSITFADFGYLEGRWEFWWNAHRPLHRIEWAIEAITHGKAQIRSAAFRELASMVGGVVDWPQTDPSPRQCQQLQDQLIAWWKREGRNLYQVRNES